jgi:hypothetical protein
MVWWWSGFACLDRFVISLAAVRRKRITVKVATRYTVRIALHLRKERAIERIIVAVVQEVVSARERSVALKLVVTIETRLTAEQRQQRSARRSITANAQLGCDNVAIGLDAEDGQEHGEIVAYVVDVLLGIDEFVEVCDSVVRQKVVVGCGIQTRAGTTNVVGSWGSVVMCGVTVCGDLVDG